MGSLQYLVNRLAISNSLISEYHASSDFFDISTCLNQEVIVPLTCDD
jgi:hypothetical protein